MGFKASYLRKGLRLLPQCGTAGWEFPKIRGALFGGPYNKDPTI